MPAAVGNGSSSNWSRTLATVLTSVLCFPVSCTAGLYIGTAVKVAIADRSEQITIDEDHPPRQSVAIVATPVNAPTSAGIEFRLVKDPQRDLAEFRRRYPGYGFLPASDQGYISRSDLEMNVGYHVLKREAGKALVWTHFHHYPVLFSLDVRATYEATESKVRLISYRVDSDTAAAPAVGLMLACLLGWIGEILWRKVVTSELQADRRDADLWAMALAEADGNVRKAESRYIAKQVKQLKRGGGASTEPIPNVLTIEYPRILGIIALFSAITICAFLDLLLAGIGVALMPRIWAAPGGNTIILLLVFVLMVVFSWHLWYLVRNRESIFTTFRVSQTELIIENSRHGVLKLNWDEVTSATYSRIGIHGKTITLEAPQLAKPLVIMSRFRTPGSNARFVIAQMVIERAMGDRWVERWF